MADDSPRDDLAEAAMDKNGQGQDQSPTFDQSARVAEKERAVIDYSKRLTRISDILSASPNSLDSMNLKDWNSVYADVEKERKRFRFMVGIVGDSGMGKSSLVNALLGQKSDIAPTSQSGACTAAVCCFHYNQSTDPKTAFKARIRLKSREKVENELSAFFQEYREFEEQRSCQVGHDTVVQGEKQRLEQQLELICEWSGLSAQELRTWGHHNSISEITRNCAESDELFKENSQEAKNINISAATAADFLRQIKRYIGSAGMQKQRQLWPLVEIVDIYLKAPLLKPGIVLVDLPGESDALESRSQVARQYYNQIEQTIVVTPCDRAADNRTAVEILREDQILDMEADAKLGENLAIVITKIDQIKWRDFITNEWAPDDISADFPGMLAALTANEKRLNKLNAHLDDNKDDDEMEDDEDDLQDPALDLDQDINVLKSLQLQLQNECKDLEAACFRACIEARSSEDKGKFQKLFDKVRAKINRKNDDAFESIPLNVFPVSSDAQRKLLRKNPELQFPDKEATGFRQLEAWIKKGSLQKREEHADQILFQYAGLFDGLSAWIEDGQQVLQKLPAAEFAKIKKVLESEIEDLSKNLHNSHKGLNTHLGRKNKLNEALHKDTSRDSLEKGFENLVNSYQNGTDGVRIHWASYGALIRRCGGLYKTSVKPRKIHDWQSRQYTYFWGAYAQDWNTVFHQNLPRYVVRLRTSVQRKISHHIRRVQKSKDLPQEFKDTFKTYLYRLENIARMYPADLNAMLSKYRASATNVKQDSRDVMTKVMEPGYKNAQNCHGNGTYQKQIEALSEHAKKVAPTIFETVAEKAREGLKISRQNLTHDHNIIIKRCVSRIRQLEEGMAQKICNGTSQPSKQAPKKEIEVVKAQIEREIKAWLEDWTDLKARLPAFKIEELTEEQLEALDRDEDELAEEQEKPRNKTTRGTKMTAKKRTKSAAQDKNAGPEGSTKKGAKRGPKKRKAETKIKEEEVDEPLKKKKSIHDASQDDVGSARAAS